MMPVLAPEASCLGNSETEIKQFCFLRVRAFVWWRLCSTGLSDYQYGGECTVLTNYIICTEEAHQQYRQGCAVRWRMFSGDLSHQQYSGGCAVLISHISTMEHVQYRTT